MNAFVIGQSAITAGQSALDIIGQNLANVATTGYHRQQVSLTNGVSGGVGVGVDVASITRYSADPVRAAILNGNSDLANVTARYNVRQQVESTLGSGTGGIGDQLTNLFNQVTQLTSNPDNTAARRPIVAAAAGLAQQFNTSAANIDQLRSNIGVQIPQAIDQVNSLSSQIADLNVRISSRTQQGQQPNDLLDQRDQLVDSLSKLIDVKTVSQPYGVVNVISSNAVVVAGGYANKFSVAADPSANGNLVVSQSGTTQPVTFQSGSLAGQLQEFNTDIPATRARLDALAGRLISTVNAVQATGLGLGGPITATTGTNSATSATAPLNAAGLPFPVTAGQLTVSVTDASGNRTNTSISIDPTTDTLTSVAAALNNVPGLTASVTSPSNTLQIQAQSGYSFDFAGRDSNPAGSGAVANPDSAGLLAALGVNGLFTGANAASIKVDPAIAADPNRLAASRTGQPGDGTNLERFAALRDATDAAGHTMEADFADQAAAVGSQLTVLSDQNTTQSGVVQTLTNQEQSVTGVDTNTELINLLTFQRMVAGASKYLSVVNASMDTIMNIIK